MSLHYMPPHLRNRDSVPYRTQPNRSVEPSSSSQSIHAPSTPYTPSVPSTPYTPHTPYTPYTPYTPSIPSTSRQRSRWSPADTSTAQRVLASDPNDIKHRKDGSKRFTKMNEMELLGTVSRSGGMGDEGDALKDHNTQERFRAYIQEKLNAFHERFPHLQSTMIPPDETLALEVLGSVLLLLRKLREGVMAAHRYDAFAIEVYETSALYALQASNHAQFVSSISVLVPQLYTLADQRSDKEVVETAERAISRLSISTSAASTSQSTNSRNHFASLLLLYQLSYLENAEQFLTFYNDWTSPSRSSKRKKRRSEGNRLLDDQDVIPRDNAPFVEQTDVNICLAMTTYRALSISSPIAYAKCQQHPAVTEHQRILLDWGAIKLRDKMWEVMKKSYLSMTLEWAGKLLLFSSSLPAQTSPLDEWDDPKLGRVREWCSTKGVRLEGDRLYIR